jgi:hypothetical protein
MRIKRTSGRNYRKPKHLEVENLLVWSTTGAQDVNYGTFWKVRPPPKRKKELRTA